MPAHPHFHLDALREMVITGLGQAASSLNMMLDSTVELDVPSIAMFTREELLNGRNSFGNPHLSCVQVAFCGPFSGRALLTFPPLSAARLVAALVGDQTSPSDLNAVTTDTLSEIGNILLNCVIGTIGNILAEPFELSLPHYLEGKLEDLLQQDSRPATPTALLALTRFRTDDHQIEGNIVLLVELGGFNALLSLLENSHPPQG